MKSNYKIAAAVIGSFVLGLGAASVLHAQAKPPAYVVAEVDVKDQDGYVKDFLPKTQANMKEFGGAEASRRDGHETHQLAPHNGD
jgi:hypothetical protein